MAAPSFLLLFSLSLLEQTTYWRPLIHHRMAHVHGPLLEEESKGLVYMACTEAHLQVLYLRLCPAPLVAQSMLCKQDGRLQDLSPSRLGKFAPQNSTRSLSHVDAGLAVL